MSLLYPLIFLPSSKHIMEIFSQETSNRMGENGLNLCQERLCQERFLQWKYCQTVEEAAQGSGVANIPGGI